MTIYFLFSYILFLNLCIRFPLCAIILCQLVVDTRGGRGYKERRPGIATHWQKFSMTV